MPVVFAFLNLWYKVKDVKSSNRLFLLTHQFGPFSEFCNCRVFFYTHGCLAEGHWSQSNEEFNSRSLYGTLHSYRVLLIHYTFPIPRVVWKKAPAEVLFYLDYASSLCLHESGTRVSLVSFMLVSKVSYYLDFYSLLQLTWLGTRLLRGLALSQVSLHFSIFTSFAHGHLSRRRIISGYALLLYFHVQQHVIWFSLPLHSE